MAMLNKVLAPSSQCPSKAPLVYGQMLHDEYSVVLPVLCHHRIVSQGRNEILQVVQHPGETAEQRIHRTLQETVVCRP